LLENAVDAGSTSIEVLVRDGGLKLLQITDNGHGIDREDLPILCERFTTSKLKAFEDLSSIGTYGFRGEALASISHIAHLRVTTKTAQSSCAWQAHYADGKLTPAKPGQSPDPKPCAGRPGTQITVEDLFYNAPNRRRAFRSPSEEYAKILDVVGRYAVHCTGVAISIKKHGESGVGISIPATACRVDRIRQLHGAAVANELVEFSTSDPKWGFKATGWTSNANYHVKRTTILLFINHRSVESSAIKKAVEQTYSTFLPKGGHPFVYLSLDIDPARVDVNVHPTKREVHFLHEDEIIEAVCNEIKEKLAKVDTSRTFLAQTLLPGAPPMTPAQPRTGVASESSPTPEGAALKTPVTKKPYENNLVRTDSKMRKITSMLPPSMIPRDSLDDDAAHTQQDGIQYETTDREQVTIRLTSIKTLRAAVRDAMHNGLTEIFASHTYVGLVDDFRRLAAIQAGVKLFLVDYGLISNEFFYQVGLTNFGNFGSIVLDPPPDLKELLEIAARFEKDAQGPDVDLDVEYVSNMVLAQLISRKEMLKEYFSLDISDEGRLLSIPLLLKGYMPSLTKLPRFLLRLGPFVDWTDEQKCFESFLRELSSFYVPEKLPPKGKISPRTNNSDVATPVSSDGEDGEDDVQYEEMVEKRREELSRVLEHVLFPAFRSRIVATNALLKGTVEVANLKGLYRVFERC
jgi:DNA mismatch repair protein MLH1